MPLCAPHVAVPLPSTRYHLYAEYLVHHFFALFAVYILMSQNYSVELCGLFNLIYGTTVYLFFSYLFSVISMFHASWKTNFSHIFSSLKAYLLVVYLDNLTCDLTYSKMNMFLYPLSKWTDFFLTPIIFLLIRWFYFFKTSNYPLSLFCKSVYADFKLTDSIHARHSSSISVSLSWIIFLPPEAHPLESLSGHPHIFSEDVFILPFPLKDSFIKPFH